ncbi:hypothetical protein [Mycoplasmopsis felifaucium]|uniref:Uncharacterized protein n=1 Tax=Mycoplasmopsis felifaucium TaxID=35768 RepID=A0ABZ2RSZ5_9BACT
MGDDPAFDDIKPELNTELTKQDAKANAENRSDEQVQEAINDLTSAYNTASEKAQPIFDEKADLVNKIDAKKEKINELMNKIKDDPNYSETYNAINRLLNNASPYSIDSHLENLKDSLMSYEATSETAEEMYNETKKIVDDLNEGIKKLEDKLDDLKTNNTNNKYDPIINYLTSEIGTIKHDKSIADTEEKLNDLIFTAENRFRKANNWVRTLDDFDAALTKAKELIDSETDPEIADEIQKVKDVYDSALEAKNTLNNPEDYSDLEEKTEELNNAIESYKTALNDKAHSKANSLNTFTDFVKPGTQNSLIIPELITQFNELQTIVNNVKNTDYDHYADVKSSINTLNNKLVSLANDYKTVNNNIKSQLDNNPVLTHKPFDAQHYFENANYNLENYLNEFKNVSDSLII